MNKKENKNQKIIEYIEKIVINTGVGKLANKPNFKKDILPAMIKELSMITSQKVSERPAQKSIAGFSIREGDIIGLKTTLRGKRMADFLIRIDQIAFPRVRDFKGIDLKNIDKNGNINVGFKDKSVFPEIDMDKSQIDFGFQVTIVPKEKSREKAIEIYRKIGVPLKKE